MNSKSKVAISNTSGNCFGTWVQNSANYTTSTLSMLNTLNITSGNWKNTSTNTSVGNFTDFYLVYPYPNVNNSKLVFNITLTQSLPKSRASPFYG